MSANLDFLESHIEGLSGQALPMPCYVFGMHKGGSTMLDNFFDVYCRVAKLRSISISDLLFRKGVSDDDYSADNSLVQLFEHKLLFRGFRYIPGFVLSHKYRFVDRPAVALVRDPRDCVVSAYFSFLKTHVITSGADSDAAARIQAERATHSQSTVDEYAEKEIQRFVGEIEGILAFAHPNLMISRYEDMIFQKAPFFRRVIEHLCLPWHEKAFERALAHVDVFPESERPDQHIRNVAPGNYKQKLSAVTIERISHQAREILAALDYA